MQIITRPYYADRIESWLGKDAVLVLTGQRRVGKSYLLKDLKARKEAEANVIYIDKEKRAFSFIQDGEQLGEYIEQHLDPKRHNYLLIDEIQDIEAWEKPIRSFRTEDNIDIIITGSNSKMLSSELSTLLSGRYHEINVQPLSYLEFMEFHQLADTDQTLQMYLNYGGLPGLKVIGLDDDEQVWEYLRGVFNTVMLKDVIERHNIRNLTFLNNLITFLADTTGKLCSATNISKYMKGIGQNVSSNVVIDYTSYFTEAYLLDTVQRYDIHGRKLFETNQKVYFGDVGLRNLIVGGEREGDIEKLLENVIYQHLVRLGYNVKVGELRVGEIDFVCTRAQETKYVQAAYLIDNEETRQREFGRLKDIRNDYPKYVISMTPLLTQRDHEGISHLSLRHFLTHGL